MLKILIVLIHTAEDDDDDDDFGLGDDGEFFILKIIKLSSLNLKFIHSQMTMMMRMRKVRNCKIIF